MYPHAWIIGERVGVRKGPRVSQRCRVLCPVTEGSRRVQSATRESDEFARICTEFPAY